MSHDNSNTNSHEYQDAPIFNDESKSKKDKGFPLLKANFEVAREFLSQFDEEKFSFRTFYDPKIVIEKDKQGCPFGSLHGKLSTYEKSLQARNNIKAGIFYNTQITDLQGGGLKNIIGLRCIFVEDDTTGQLRNDFPLSPSIIVESSPNKFHYYWLLDKPNTLFDEWSNMLLVLIKDWGSDPNVKDYSRVLRVPGFWHLKHDPFQVRLVNVTGLRYSWNELKTSFNYRIIGLGDNKENLGDNKENKEGGNKGGGESSTEDRTLDDMIQKMIDWVNNSGLHLTIRDYMLMKVKDNKYPTVKGITLEVQAFMQFTPAGKRDDEWNTYYKDVERQVRDTIQKYKYDSEPIDLTNSTIDNSIVNDDIPMPPGMLGELVDNAYYMAKYRYRETAFVSAIGLLAGICGRKYNVSDTGLNVYLTLIAETGTGKESINDFIESTLIDFSLGNTSSFLGVKRFTGPKTIINKMIDARSKICICSEAGLLLKSSAGDQTGVKRTLLSLYTKSGYQNYSGDEGYSNEKDDIPSLNAPALSLISESTPKVLLKAFKDDDSLDDGSIARQNIYRIKECAYESFDLKRELDKHIKEKLKIIHKNCLNIQAKLVLRRNDIIEMQYADGVHADVQKFSHEMTSIRKNNENSDELRTMASRASIHALKFASLATIMNRDDNTINFPEWNWAKEIVRHELANVDFFFHGGESVNNFEDLSRNVVGKVILKLIQNKYDSVKNSLSADDMKANRIPYEKLHRQLLSIKKLIYSKKIENPIQGLDDVLKYMVNSGYLGIEYNGNKRTYVVKGYFLDLISRG